MTAYRTADVDGVEVFYREAGAHGSPPLLLLHGFPTSSTQYGELIDRLSDRFHLIAPDYPGFGYTEPLAGTTTFDRLADVIEGFADAVGLDHYALYVFDFGAPVGFRLATRRPERVDALIVQNGNAYEAGIGPNLAGLAPYWADRVAAEPAARTFLALDATRAQYVEGVGDPQTVDPDHWTLDQHFLDLPGRDRVMLDLFYDYQSNVALYPAWQAYLREHQPPTLITWGAEDRYFVADGARAYLADVPGAELHLLDTGHFALATHAEEIAGLITAFYATSGAGVRRASGVGARA
jgi:pimeloyl-ACP methyl ester carboxylesterase